ncbi:aspartate/glutamate racemase family protein [Salipiger mangrovisoli]|uniref:Asp/Glu racemase n=1 Tax=Salipiger mangrovisoli TaxID=2865933 RepID=A0ABR9WVF9_9RHOB|nr:aspartate/glutamate racemase family protein [Salipiger mangrovisoli]MBE9635280.1 Asp/Glu racemase [Salipiger mangrovisoli]
MNPNSNAATTRTMCGIAGRVLPRVSGWTAPEGPALITSAQALHQAAIQVAAAQLEPGISGVIVSAFGDPGLEALSARLRVPVVGIGSAAARAAAAEGRAFAVVTHTPGLETSIDALMNNAGSAGRYLGTYLADGDPIELSGDPEKLDAALLYAAKLAHRDGAEAVIIGGGPLGEAADRLADHAPCILVSPILHAALEMRAKLRLPTG